MKRNRCSKSLLGIQSRRKIKKPLKFIEEQEQEIMIRKEKKDILLAGIPAKSRRVSKRTSKIGKATSEYWDNLSRLKSADRSVFSEDLLSKERPKKRREKVGCTRLLPGPKQKDKLFDEWLNNSKSEWKKKIQKKQGHRALLLDTESNSNVSGCSDIMKELVHKAALTVQTINEENNPNKMDGHSNISILANETVPYLMAPSLQISCTAHRSSRDSKSIKRPKGRPRKRGTRICVYEGCGRHKQASCKGYCMAHHTMIWGEKDRKRNKTQKLIVRRRTPKKWSKLVQMKGKPILKKQSCGKCNVCLLEDCGKCMYCLDKPRFGGEYKLRQRCVRRQCLSKRKVRITWDAATEVKASARSLADAIIKIMKVQRPRGRPRKNQGDLGSRKRRGQSSLEQPVSAKSSNQYAKIYNPSIRGKKIRITADAVEAVGVRASSLVEAIIEEESIDPSDLKIGSRVLVDSKGTILTLPFANAAKRWVYMKY